MLLLLLTLLKQLFYNWLVFTTWVLLAIDKSMSTDNGSVHCEEMTQSALMTETA